jgi:hypothetical protein
MSFPITSRLKQPEGCRASFTGQEIAHACSCAAKLCGHRVKAVSLANPYTYGVDLLKHATLGVLPSGMGADFRVWVDLAVLAGFTLAALLVASWRFSQESAYEPMIHILTGKHGGG